MANAINKINWRANINTIGNETNSLGVENNNTISEGTTISPNGQTCLEKVGFDVRGITLMRNRYGKESEYSKQIVDDEYNVQSEFVITSYQDRLEEQARNNEIAKEYKEKRKLDKLQSQVDWEYEKLRLMEEKIAKRKRKAQEKEEKQKAKQDRKERKETVKEPSSRNTNSTVPMDYGVGDLTVDLLGRYAYFKENGLS